MNRRKFFRNMFGAVAATAVPSIIKDIVPVTPSGISPIIPTASSWIKFAEAAYWENWYRGIENQIWYGNSKIETDGVISSIKQ